MRIVPPALILTLVLFSGSAAAATATTTFAFDDARYLQPGEKDGGLVDRVDASATGTLPLLVYLHGTNEKGPLHRGLGAPGFDLRKTVGSMVSGGIVAPLLIAGPSTTRDAWTGSRLWSDFDLDRFVSSTEAALLPKGVRVDRTRVILAGHSGAGCNLKGGLLAPSVLKPLAILAMDTCLDADFGAAFGEAAARAPVHVIWQPTWPRDVAAFDVAFGDALLRDSARSGELLRIDVAGGNAHEDLVPTAVERELRLLLPMATDPE